jgi:hypothetical protein
MANTVNLLSYANTFGEWMITTNGLVRENNDFGYNNYIKPTGTLYLNDPNLGLQVANNVIIAGGLQVQGVGSSGYIQNNLSVDGQIYFTNPTLGLTNAGQANIGGPLLALGAGNGLQVSNDAQINGNLTIYKTTTANTLNANTITANSVVANVTSKLSSIDYLSVNNQLTVTGDFVITGTTVYNTNKFTLNSGNSAGLTSYYIVNRGTSGANAEIRWNEPSQYWDILDVGNGSNYSRILTANLISDSITSTSSSTMASSKAANTLNNSIQTNAAAIITANNSLKSYVDNNVTSVTSFTQSAYNKANGAVQTAFTTISANGTSFTSAANTGTFTITSAAANGINVLNSATNTIDLGLRTTGVVAGQYGSTFAIPTITVDTFGRVTAVSTNTVSGTAATSGYSPNAIIFANTTGYLSNTSSLQYTASNNTLIVANVAVSGTIANAKLQSYSETVNTVSSIASANYTIDLSRANIYDITMGANVTFTFSNAPAAGTLKNCTIILRQGSGGNKFATFTNAKYTDGNPPVLSTGASQIDVLSFFTIDGGTSYFGSYSMANVS